MSSGRGAGRPGRPKPRRSRSWKLAVGTLSASGPAPAWALVLQPLPTLSLPRALPWRSRASPEPLSLPAASPTVICPLPQGCSASVVPTWDGGGERSARRGPLPTGPGCSPQSPPEFACCLVQVWVTHVFPHVVTHQGRGPRVPSCTTCQVQAKLLEAAAQVRPRSSGQRAPGSTFARTPPGWELGVGSGQADGVWEGQDTGEQMLLLLSPCTLLMAKNKICLGSTSPRVLWRVLTHLVCDVRGPKSRGSRSYGDTGRGGDSCSPRADVLSGRQTTAE